MLQEFEKRKEEILEEFIELALEKKHDYIQEEKIRFKRDKLSLNDQKERIAEIEKLFD